MKHVLSSRHKTDLSPRKGAFSGLGGLVRIPVKNGMAGKLTKSYNCISSKFMVIISINVHMISSL